MSLLISWLLGFFYYKMNYKNLFKSLGNYQNLTRRRGITKTRSIALCLTIGFYQNSKSLLRNLPKRVKVNSESPKFFNLKKMNYKNLTSIHAELQKRMFDNHMLNHRVLPKFGKLSAELQKFDKVYKKMFLQAEK